MTDQEINEKLAKAVGFKYVVPTGIIIDFWKYPDGYTDRILPDFLNDMNACLKWIVPELRRKGLTSMLCHYTEDGVKVMLSGYDMLASEWAETMSRAFCLAALKYFEEANNESA